LRVLSLSTLVFLIHGISPMTVVPALADTDAREALVAELSTWSDRWAEDVVEDWADAIIDLADHEHVVLDATRLSHLSGGRMQDLANVSVMTPSHHPLTCERAKRWLLYGLTTYFRGPPKAVHEAEVVALRSHAAKWESALVSRLPQISAADASSVVDMVLSGYLRRATNPLLVTATREPLGESKLHEVGIQWAEALDRMQLRDRPQVRITEVVSACAPLLMRMLLRASGEQEGAASMGLGLPPDLRAFEDSYASQFAEISEWEGAAARMSVRAAIQDMARKHHERAIHRSLPKIDRVLDVAIDDLSADTVATTLTESPPPAAGAQAEAAVGRLADTDTVASSDAFMPSRWYVGGSRFIWLVSITLLAVLVGGAAIVFRCVRQSRYR
jgi:hypothetical protein